MTITPGVLPTHERPNMPLYGCISWCFLCQEQEFLSLL